MLNRNYLNSLSSEMLTLIYLETSKCSENFNYFELVSHSPIVSSFFACFCNHGGLNFGSLTSIFV